MSRQSPAKDSRQDQRHTEIGVGVAMALEATPLLQRCRQVLKTVKRGLTIHQGRLGPRSIAVLVTGTAPGRVRNAAEEFLDAHQPDVMFIAGLAGALSPTLNVADIVLASEIIEPAGAAITVPLVPWHRRTALHAGESVGNVHVGRLLTVDRIIRTADEKQSLHSCYDAVAVDMETIHLARVCARRRLPFGVVRVISDDAHTDLPAEVLSLFAADRLLRIGAACRVLCNRPGCIRDLWRLRGRAHRAARRLADALEDHIAQSSRLPNIDGRG